MERKQKPGHEDRAWMNLVEEYPVIQGHRLSWNAYAPSASRSIALQFPLTKRVAASLTSPKASPIKPRANVASGSGLHDCGAARYREIDPQSTIMAASFLQDFDALDEKSLTIRSAVSPSATIRSAARGYPIDFAASEAPTQKKWDSVDTAISRRGLDGKIDEEASGFMLIEPCHNDAGFENGSGAYTNRLLLTHTARGHERDSCGNDKCERHHQHFPRRENYRAISNGW
jgi:hypothetical protein